MVKRAAFLTLVTICIFSLFAAEVLSAEETQKTTGTVISVDLEDGILTVKDLSGEVQSLRKDDKADVDLKAVKIDDVVTVETNSEGLISSLTINE